MNKSWRLFKRKVRMQEIKDAKEVKVYLEGGKRMMVMVDGVFVLEVLAEDVKYYDDRFKGE